MRLAKHGLLSDGRLTKQGVAITLRKLMSKVDRSNSSRSPLLTNCVAYNYSTAEFTLWSMWANARHDNMREREEVVNVMDTIGFYA